MTSINFANGGIRAVDSSALPLAPSSYSTVLGNGRSPIALPHTDCRIHPNVPLSKHTSYKVGGPAEWFVTPRTQYDLEASIAWANDEGVPITFLGAGSNLLVSDRGIQGLVLCTRHLRQIDFDPDTAQMTVAVGAMLPRVAWKAAERGWSGLEWAVGIPGTVGGAVVMNAGAHKACTADILLETQILTTSGHLKTLLPNDLNYRYRTSNLQGDSSRVVTQATFQLRPGHSPEAIMAATRAHQEHRHRTQPYHKPSCGSVFRNPGSQTAGWLIEQTGLKGYSIGNAQVAHRHANFILNCGNASAADIARLIRHVQAEVERHWQLWLEPEVKMMGDFEWI